MKNNWRWAAVLAFGLTNAVAAAPELKYVVILSRHGVRSPTWDAARLNQYSAQPWPDWGVPPGDLTPHGRELVKILGSYYRERFGEEHLLATRGCRDKERVYIWADTDQRTIETGRAFAESILPGCGAVIHSQAPGEKDPIFSGVAGPDPQLAGEALRRRLGPDLQQLLEDHRSELDTLQFILGKDAPKRLIDPHEPVAVSAGGRTVELQGPIATASTLSEDLLLEYADGMTGAKLGWGRLTRDNLLRVLELHRVYADLTRRTPELARARGSNLLAHILASLEQAVSGRPVPGALGPPETALLILSGHDTNQSNASGMLGLSWSVPGYLRDETPPEGALIFSLWRDPGKNTAFVGVQFLAASLDQMHDAAPLTQASPPSSVSVAIPGCEAARDENGCSWEKFKMIVQRSIESDKVDFKPR
ncbi:MAG TPA: histidine-type phosphatase [Bryobacteraceae bacterium]|nr:histidine-type phosphatase [Bryobacteraceae bacterium]